MKSLGLNCFIGLLIITFSSCTEVKYDCSCYCIGAGVGEYAETTDLTGKKATEENAEAKCKANAEASGQSCAEWMCHATQQQ